MLPIPGLNGQYSITEDGRIWSHPRNGLLVGCFKKTFVTPNGYVKVKLRVNGVNKNFAIHRLVALTFIPNPENKPHVNHIDGDKNNNAVPNLEWNTVEENINHYATRLGGYIYPKRRVKKVRQFTKEGEFIQRFHSIKQASSTTGCTVGGIYQCCNGYLPTYKGFIWQYA